MSRNRGLDLEQWVKAYKSFGCTRLAYAPLCIETIENGEEGLTPAARAEMDKIMAISHLMSLAKAKARLRLAGEK